MVNMGTYDQVLDGSAHFPTQGFERVRTEISLHVLTY